MSDEIRKYQPSSGTEGADFMERYCFGCKRDAAFQADPDNNDSCPIVAATMIYEVTDPKYPAEWRYDADGHPTCTAFDPVTP